MKMREVVTIEPVTDHEDYTIYTGGDYEAFVGIDGTWSKIGNLEQISWVEDLEENIISGDIKFATYDRDGILLANIDPKKTFSLILVATTRMGHIASLALWNIKLKQIIRGMSINDLGSTVGCTFEAEECSPLMPHSLEKTFELYMNRNTN